MKNSSKIFFHVLPVFFAFVFSSCQTPQLTLKNKPGEKPLALTLLPIGDANSIGEELGTTPKTIEMDQIKNKMLRIETTTGEFQYWFFPSLSANENTVLLSIPNKSKKSENLVALGQNAITPDTRNQVNRLLLKAYQALTGNKTSTAIELAKQASVIDPHVAAPQIILGLALLRDGKKEDAINAFEKAKALDPSDNDLERLIESAK